VTHLDGLTVIETENKKLTGFKQWDWQLPRFVNDLTKWCEVSIVKIQSDIVR
jgi:hypothetical protein